MAVANDCEPCKGVASPNGVAHSRYPENLINEENWTSGSTQNKDGREMFKVKSYIDMALLASVLNGSNSGSLRG